MVCIKTCCFCFKNTKDGSLACAVFYMVVCLMNATLCVYVLNNDEVMHTAAQKIKIGEDYARIAYISSLTETIIMFVSSVLLAIGVRKDNRYLFLPWMCCAGLECFGLIVLILLIVYFVMISSLYPVFVIILLILLFGISFVLYMLLCVSSQYQLLANMPLLITYKIFNTCSNYEIDNSVTRDSVYLNA
ncbi:uncharacterized protein [Centruroides vittatus]|uniref:uncharacterized protein n=1 Tax=Centruroides vittatus TaxID=120091 RepID=UPI00350F17D9